MKNHLRLITLGLLCLDLSIHAQPAAAPAGPNFDAATSKLFGDNQSFSATMEFQTIDPQKGDPIVMTGKMAFDSGKSRFEMDMTQMKSSRMSPSTAEQMKQMGMGTIVTIGRPDKKITYLVYPGMQSYVETAMHSSDSSAKPEDFKVETTELGKETVDGHPCVKNKVVVTYKDTAKHESTMWNATDLKNFPIKIQIMEKNDTATMSFKDVSLAKPDAAQFEPPSDYTKYDSVATMMRTEMMKKMGGGGGGGFGGLGGLLGK